MVTVTSVLQGVPVKSGMTGRCAPVEDTSARLVRFTTFHTSVCFAFSDQNQNQTKLLKTAIRLSFSANKPLLMMYHHRLILDWPKGRFSLTSDLPGSQFYHSVPGRARHDISGPTGVGC